MNPTLHFQSNIRKNAGLLVALAVFLTTGCGTTLKRIATEQLLMSDAVDRAVAQIDFTHLAGKRVFLDTQYMKTVAGIGFVNSDYVVSSLRQQLTAAHCLIQDTQEAAEVIVEPRVGTLGADGHEVVYGIPQSGAVNSAAAALSSQPFASIPEISFGKNNAQTAIAKVLVYAYDRETREPVWQSGIAKAESNSKDTWILGAGPFQKGSIYEGTRFAGKDLKSSTPASHKKIENFAGPSPVVPFDNEYTFRGNDPQLSKTVTQTEPAPPEPDHANNNDFMPLENHSVGPATYHEPVNSK